MVRKEARGDSEDHSAHFEPLLRLARESIAAYLATEAFLPFSSDEPWLNDLAAVFVTLRARPDNPGADGQLGELRGCIGQIEAEMPLYRAVQDAAVKAATVDPRFYPVTPDELDGLTIEISILSPMRRIESLEAIVVGRDGLLITGGRRRGLLLPEVPLHYGWDRDAFLQALYYKAGLPVGSWPGRARLYAFEVESFQES
jgi:AmmeMemoRadiSam system protein A